MSKKQTTDLYKLIAKFAALNSLAINEVFGVSLNYDEFMNNYKAFLDMLRDGINVDSDFEEMKDILKQEEIELNATSN